MVQIYWLSVVAFFLFIFLKLEMCAVNLDLKVLLLAASKCNATALSFLYLGHLTGPDLCVCVCVCGCACVARQDMTYESSSEHEVFLY